MRTVVILHPHFTLAGGAGKFVLETGARLADRGRRVLVVCIRASPEIVGVFAGREEFVEIGGPLSSSFLFWLLFPWVLLKVWRAMPREPFVLFPQVFPANWWGFVYKITHPRVPLVWMCQEPSAFIHSKKWLSALPAGLAKCCAHLLNPLLKPLDIWLARHVDCVFANSRATKKQACAVYGYPEDQVRICYPGVDTLAFCPEPDLERVNQVITIGRLTSFKNVDTIIRAVQILNRGRSEPVLLKIVGRGEQENELRQLVRDLDLEKAVAFCGALTDADLVRALQESKVFVLASEDEPFGIVAVEAMACGVPCVVDGSGGPAETVIDGRTGFHVGRRDPAAYARKMSAILDDERLSGLMSKQARVCSEHYSWEAATDELAQGIDEVARP
jgi:glycosyltransferase involved in cell wall biosynthesis